MKKRNLFLVLMLTLVMCLSACGEEETTSRRKRSKDKDEKIEETQKDKDKEAEEEEGFVIEEESATETEEEEEDTSDTSDEKTFKISKDLSVDNAGVKINKYWVTKDDSREAKDVVRLEITYTNNADRDRSFWHNTSLLAYQGGVRLDYGSDEEGTDDDMYVQIQPGTTVTFVHSFNLRDTTTDVELKFSSPYNTGLQRYESECTLSIK